jgi:hypothetical protein
MKNTRLTTDSMTPSLWVGLILNALVLGTVIARPSLFGAALLLIMSLVSAWAMIGARRR